jgi:hypothetical protein
VVVPAQTGDAAVVVASVEDDQVEKVAQLERPPDAQVVVEVDLAGKDELAETLVKSRTEGLPDGHPLKVSPHSIHLALVNADGRTVGAEGLFRVVQGTETVSVTVVGHLCVCD